ncbi:hypothetical protein KP509_08G052600 [Ceratopteris richardii]|uniref:J domain-containing protein n=1 Tax=Ceratopteris richardii TaxID=49495 RepID=A0A8T2U9Y2_CERRI|nr:hypothetical protein KP509_08G052600 [Ceratopteris richardii]KAH7431508.1 hypothetical protein KP509_08G052600 [Ceratopteris richardii]KAH7431509.1 hypothetical protein KP509_08G052600 [Ceratopteris richardii]
MECNRDEAMRALEMAEQKFVLKDFYGAKRLVLKAQQLFPALESIAQMIAVIDVHVAAQTRIGIHEKDWYAILQIEPTADDALVKRQYRKLALILHPDKNKSSGAESAFKLVGEALQVLSDKVKRLVYDAKRGMHAKVNQTFPGGTDSANNAWKSTLFQNQQNYYSDVANTVNKASQRHFAKQTKTAPEFHLFTFWTACTSCYMRYQYYRKYENQNLLCPQCRKPFIAKDISNMYHANATQTWASQARETFPTVSQACQFNSDVSPSYKPTSHNFMNYSTSGCKYFNGCTSGGRLDSFQMYPGATSHLNNQGTTPGEVNIHPFTDRMQDDRNAELLKKINELRSEVNEKARLKKQARKAAGHFKASKIATFDINEEQARFDRQLAGKFNLKKQAAHMSSSDSEVDGKLREAGSLKVGNDAKASTTHFSTLKRNVSLNGIARDTKEGFSGKKARLDTEVGFSSSEAAEMTKKLADLARNTIRVRLNLQGKRPASHAVPSQESSRRGNIHEPNTRWMSHLYNRADSSVKLDETAASCSVPDADFHNFDEDREEKDVEVGQVWALYDDKDGMPKYYMKVKEVHSRSPFRVSIVWFELRKPSDEVCELLDMGFSIACGEFRPSSSQIMDSVNSFSHLVNWEKSGKGLIKIYPKKGEIWCIYKKWEAGQHVFTIEIGLASYMLVEVLSDCCETSGASVIPLQKIEGFKTIYQLSNEAVFQIPFPELLRFSHRVPAHRMKGDETPNIPKDCWELDPAAIPPLSGHPSENGVTDVPA